jgi:hypothetical protein
MACRQAPHARAPHSAAGIGPDRTISGTRKPRGDAKDPGTGKSSVRPSKREGPTARVPKPTQVCSRIFRTRILQIRGALAGGLLPNRVASVGASFSFLPKVLP